jgi:arylsulfatase A-like enzyme
VLDEPLVIRYPPGIQAGAVVHAPVSLRDLPATILDLVGMPDQRVLPGRSLVGCWRPDAGSCAPSPAYSELRWEEDGSKLWSLHLDGKQYIRWGDTLEVIYDWDHDPEETVDLTKMPDGAALLATRRPIVDSLYTSRSTVAP